MVANSPAVRCGLVDIASKSFVVADVVVMAKYYFAVRSVR